ncbi:hypothetical protein ABPG72_021916 [Tetrahymena utriculariae]
MFFIKNFHKIGFSQIIRNSKQKEIGFKIAGKTIDEVQAFWDSYSEEYTSYDCGSSVFYLSLLNMLKIEKLKAILEAGAGAGFLYQHTLNRKSTQAKYTATDLSEKILYQMFKRLKIEDEFMNDHYQSCRDEMLKESYRVLEKGGVAGFTVWRLEQKYVWTIIPDILSELGTAKPDSRSHFHLGDKNQLIKMMEDTGYTNVISWTQVSPYSYTCDEDILKFLELSFNVSILELAGERKEEIKLKVIERFKEYMYVKKQAIGHCGLLVIGTKN